jgi:Protein of unknown function (DUF3017)
VEESVLTEPASRPDTDSRPILDSQNAGGGDVLIASAVPASGVARGPGPARGPRLAWLPYAIAFAAAACGLVLIALSSRLVQAGTVTVGGALILAAAERLVLPERRAGMLVTRHRLIDVTILAGLGAAILVVALVLPKQT